MHDAHSCASKSSHALLLPHVAVFEYVCSRYVYVSKGVPLSVTYIDCHQRTAETQDPLTGRLQQSVALTATVVCFTRMSGLAV